ncbi:Oligopeptide transport ATP-binding protein OppF [Haloplasma contractile SSD-17B]|uniref:Oligopeptide transport ATP-binding protein OppF n=1 Tax=Haloplasma contractile SSD-17B TaxID=1033810 RepID=U2EFG4_9MOLU|nr:ATP-binding cassette domain-containing protein [Haloplasma contractile]ERJ13406.1 Oligopeptide transport ATP-binding protein OppF [Haloplasma contractile SSD-17B]
MANDKREVILEVKNLKQHFKTGKKTVKAVDDVSFEIYKGETFGLVGESGSGKTTTGRSIIKLYNITDGEVFFKGKRTSVNPKSIQSRIKKLQVGITREVERKLSLVEELEQKIYDLRIARNAKVRDLKEEIELLKERKSNRKLNKINDKIEEIDSEMNQKIVKLEDRIIKVQEEIEQDKARNLNNSDLEKLIEELKTDLPKATLDNKVTEEFTMDLQMIFQDPMASLNPRMTVRNIIAEGLDISYKRKPRAERQKLAESYKEKREEKIEKLINIVGLDKEHLNRYPHEFSGGQRQRIGIARALITNPDFIIADEPISALDVSIQAQVVNLMNKLKDEFGLTYLFIAHDLSMVRFISDRLGVMHLGKLVEYGDADKIYNNPVHPYTKSLLSAIPLPDPDYEQGRRRIKYDKTYIAYNAGGYHEVSKDHFVLGTKEEVEAWKAE